MTPSTNPARDEAVLITREMADAGAKAIADERKRVGLQYPDTLAVLAYQAMAPFAPAPASGVDAVAVKPLEWFESLAVLPEQHASAQSVIGSYKAITFLTVGREPSLVSYWHGPEGRDIRVESFDEAKAAAQADYEQRIRSALSPAATSGSEAVGEPDMWSPKLEAIRLLKAEDQRQLQILELLETIREQVRLGVKPEHRPDGLMKNLQTAVYGLRGRMPLLNDAAIMAPLQAKPSPPAGGDVVRDAVDQVRYHWEVIQGQCSEGDGFTERAATDLELSIVALEAALSQSSSAAEPVAITARYTNWRGETAERTFIPHRVFFGSNEWHPEPQVLIEATDCEKGALRTFAAAGFAHPAPAAVESAQGVKDGRRADWTEALAISFMAANGHNPEMGMFAKSFNEGAWREIEQEWPEFIEFAEARIRASLATEG